MKRLILFLALFFSATTVFAHAGHSHQKEATTVSAINDSLSYVYQQAHNTGSLSDFQKLHPLIVHFPIVLLILAFLLQLVNLFTQKKDLSWVTLFLIVFGFIGAYLATNTGFHGGDPDLSQLSDIARQHFETHDQFAHLTVWISGVATLLKIGSHFFLKRKLWIEIVTVLVMLGAVYCIHTTGEMGARLVHIDAIGVQGHKVP